MGYWKKVQFGTFCYVIKTILSSLLTDLCQPETLHNYYAGLSCLDSSLCLSDTIHRLQSIVSVGGDAEVNALFNLQKNKTMVHVCVHMMVKTTSFWMVYLLNIE